MSNNQQDLARRVLHGAAYLSLRQILGLGISVAGMVIMARLVGPTAYGTYAIAAGIFTVLSGIGQLGIGTYLIRLERNPARADLDEAFTLLAAVGAGLWLMASAAAVMLPYWTPAPNVCAVALAVFSMILPQLVINVPQAVLERKLDYAAIAKIDLSAQVAFHSVSLTLAVLGCGVWSPVGASWASIIVTSAMMFGGARYRPSLRWNSAAVRGMVAYGVAFATADWIWQMRALVNSLIVGRFAGPDAVGSIALTIRVVDALASAKTVAVRVAIPALGNLQGDEARTTRAVNEGTSLQVFAVGVPLFAFAFVGPPALPLLLGRDWSMVSPIFPFVAASALMQAVYSLPAMAMRVRGRNWSMALFASLHVGLFFAAGLALVPHLGIIGYGVSEMLAFAAYALLYRLCATMLPELRIGPSLIWAVGFGAALFWQRFGPWLSAAAFLPALLPQARMALTQCWARGRTLWGRRRPDLSPEET
jgi:O-antigen/teichoic acid export membrane protein